MDYLLTEEQKMIKDLAHKIAEEKIRPVADKCKYHVDLLA